MRPIVTNPLNTAEARSAAYAKAEETYTTEKRRTIARLANAPKGMLKKTLKNVGLQIGELQRLALHDECAQAEWRRKKPVLDAEEAGLQWLLNNAETDTARTLKAPRTTLAELRERRKAAREIAAHCAARRVNTAVELCRKAGFSTWPEANARFFQEWAAFIDGLIQAREAQEGGQDG